jgi:hypothetical protein
LKAFRLTISATPRNRNRQITANTAERQMKRSLRMLV